MEGACTSINQIKRTENSWVLPEKQNQIAVLGRTISSPPLIANRSARSEDKTHE